MPRGRPRRPQDAGLNEFDTVQVSPDISADVSLTPDIEEERASLSQAPEVGTKEYEAYVAQLRQSLKRQPYGAQVQKLALPMRSGYKRHWFNDVGGRVQDFRDAGWSHVTDNSGRPVKRTVGSGRDNKALIAYAMEIPSVFWEEAQQAIFAEAQARMDDIKKAPIRAEKGTAQASDRDKFYSPREEIISMRDTLSRS